MVQFLKNLFNKKIVEFTWKGTKESEQEFLEFAKNLEKQFHIMEGDKKVKSKEDNTLVYYTPERLLYLSSYIEINTVLFIYDKTIYIK